jgi:hypothetical protein
MASVPKPARTSDERPAWRRAWTSVVLAALAATFPVHAADPPDPANLPEYSLVSIASRTRTVFGVQADTPLHVPPSVVTPTLGDALLAMAPAGYTLREIDGVPVLRPTGKWDGHGLLEATLPGEITLEGTPWRDAVDRVCRAVGPVTMRWWDTMPADDHDMAGRGEADARRLTLRLPRGTTVLSALTAIVRAHGGLAWAAAPDAPGTALRVWTFHRQGHGCVVPPRGLD